MQHKPEVRQAVLAALVRMAAATKDPPKDIPSVAAFTEQQRRDSIGPLGQWLQDRLQVTGDPRDVVSLNALWATLVEELGEAEGRVGGFTREETWRLARALTRDLPRAKYAGKGRGMEWRGVRVVAEAGEDHKPCVECDTTIATAFDGIEAGRCRDCADRAFRKLGGGPPASGPLQEAADEAEELLAAEEAAQQLALNSAPPGDSVKPISDELLKCALARDRIAAFRAAAPDSILTRQDVAALGGARNVIFHVVADVPTVVTIPEKYWRVLLTEMHEMIEADIARAVEERQAGYIQRLRERLSVWPGPSLQTEGGAA